LEEAEVMSDGRVQAAVVVALVTLSVALLGEMFLRLRERRVRRESATTVYRKYADPLAAASTALFYRLREIFDERGEGFYLQNHEHVVRYEHYKAISTLYRLAAFLGWVQGLKRELFFVPRTRPRRDAGLERELRRLESALADGDWVEEVRLESLLRLSSVTAPTSKPTLAKLATKLDFRVDVKGSRFSTGTIAAVDEITNMRATNSG
ncbi:hypothetical protein, partial [Mycobacterium sp.]|uniref:hypothetical protein n=1 Tax=Mycobacterium sp. TaxID=1785 RepID=UPI003C726638